MSAQFDTKLCHLGMYMLQKFSQSKSVTYVMQHVLFKIFDMWGVFAMELVLRRLGSILNQSHVYHIGS